MGKIPIAADTQQVFAQALNETDSEEEDNEGIIEDGSWPDMNPNLMDVVHDVTAAFAQNDTSGLGWAEIQQIPEAATCVLQIIMK